MSLPLYVRAVVRHWFILFVFVGAAAVGLIQEYWTSFALPAFAWFAIALAAFVVAQFRAFHDLRLRRDQLHAEIQERFDSVRYRFEMSYLTGVRALGQVADEDTPGTEGYQFTLVFSNGGLEPLEYEVERVSIVLGDGDTFGPDLVYASRRFIILPGREHRFRLHFIPTDDPKVRGGEGDYDVTYGHPSKGARRFRTRHQFLIGWEVEGGVARAFHITQGEITHEPI